MATEQSDKPIWRIEETRPGRAYFYMHCEVGGAIHGEQTRRECARSLWTQPASGTMWQWDGNKEQPTITPSIDCQGGCRRHFTMIKGVANGL